MLHVLSIRCDGRAVQDSMTVSLYDGLIMMMLYEGRKATFVYERIKR